MLLGSVVTLGNTWGTGDRMIYYDGINCDGSESTIIECAKTTISINTDANEWYSYERAGVSCENRQLAGTQQPKGCACMIYMYKQKIVNTILLRHLVSLEIFIIIKFDNAS